MYQLIGPARPWARRLVVSAVVVFLMAAPRALQAQGQLADSLAAVLVPAELRAAIRATSPELASHRAVLALAEARRAATGFAPATTLSAELDDVPGARLDQGSARVEVEQEFLARGQRRAERALADTEVRAAQIALQAAERRIMARAARAYIEATGWRAVATRLAGQDSLLASAEASLRVRFAAGDASYVSVLRLRTERLRVQSDRARALTEAETGTIALESLLAEDLEAQDRLPTLVANIAGAAPGRSVGTVITLPEAPPVDSLLALAGQVQHAEAAVERAMASRQLVLARQRPAFAALLGIQRMGASGEESASLGPVLGVRMSLPFTARRANQAAAVAAAQEVTAAHASRVAIVATARGAIAQARARYEAARSRLATFDAALLRGAAEERESALAAYRAGDLSLIELLDFERALSRTEIERMHAIIDAAGALAALLSGDASGDATGAPTFRITEQVTNDDR